MEPVDRGSEHLPVVGPEDPRQLVRERRLPGGVGPVDTDSGRMGEADGRDQLRQPLEQRDAGERLVRARRHGRYLGVKTIVVVPA
jgi:hypothetical protein